MKKQFPDSIRNPVVTIDKSLDKYNGVVLFPEKLAKAKAIIEKGGFPPGFKKNVKI